MMEKKRVQSLDRAFELLEILCKSQNGMTIHQLSSATDLNKSTVHRLLHTMIEWGVVQRSVDEAIYRPGMHICELSEHIQNNLDIVAISKSILKRLSHETAETVHLAMQDGYEIVYIHKIVCAHGSIQMSSKIGMHRPLYCTGVGKAILSTLSDPEIETIWNESDIRSYTPYTIVDKKVFLNEIETIRQQGYAFDKEENELGVCCIAAAIPDWRGRASHALSVSIPVSRMTEDRKKVIIDSLQNAVAEISSILGGQTAK